MERRFQKLILRGETEQMEHKRLQKNHVALVYDKIADRFDETRFAIWKGVDAFLRNLSPGSYVLDSGCGNGKYARYAVESYPSIRFHGLDACGALLNIASEKAPASDWTRAGATRLPFRDGVFDAVISIAVLHHIACEEDRRDFLREIARVLRPGGRAYVTVWASNAAKPKWKPLDGMGDWLVPWIGVGDVHWRYYHLFENGELEGLVSEACEDVALSGVEFEMDNWCASFARK